VVYNIPSRFKKSHFIKVSREDYLDFIRKYPKPLEWNCTGICESPLGSWNDFSDGAVWPESIVAKEIRNWMTPNGELDNSMPGKYWEYYILLL
jgi:hypothetical protein